MTEDPQELEYALERVIGHINEAKSVIDGVDEPGEELDNITCGYDHIEETLDVLRANREDIQLRLKAARAGRERPNG